MKFRLSQREGRRQAVRPARMMVSPRPIFTGKHTLSFEKEMLGGNRHVGAGRIVITSNEGNGGMYAAIIARLKEMGPRQIKESMAAARTSPSN